MDRQLFLAYRYARALFAVVMLPCEDSFIAELEAFAVAIGKNRSFWFNATSSDCQKAAGGLLSCCRFDILGDLLQRDGRLWLFPDIVAAFSALYQQRCNVLWCTVRISHELTVEQHAELGRFLEKIAGKKVFFTVKRDPSLIAGIRVEGETVLWECSIAQRLRALQRLP
ncbi:MAG: F0F1 ATP synthase subunit delta [Candidatus Babeliaceae bacterium]|nr:F0F1 ATP synthase subunit delta [Candidatus Babeliaceae bacterium]